VLFRSEERLTRKQVEASLGISQAAAVKLLSALTDKYMLKRVGRGKDTKYERAAR
jgi:ATP-dependent DNA helicase RecG